MGSRPLWFLLVFAASISTDRDRATANKILGNEQNIGTVLFGRSDCSKHCWTSEEYTILNSRRMFQDLLPKPKVINYQNDQYIALLMDYFHICLECVRQLAVGKTKHLMLKALADTMGGYLRTYVLPLTRKSYYAGNIKYRNAKKLFELFDELKNFLRTNGVGWSRPARQLNQISAPPIVIIPTTTTNACNGLITYLAPNNKSKKKHKKRASKKKKRRRFAPKETFRALPDDNEYKRKSLRSVIVPLPFLDNEVEPNSIALPFKTDSLQSLYCEKSAFALVKYYVASAKCIVSRSKSKKELVSFNSGLHKWLQQSVENHLDDEKWYPAFGGVLRIKAALEESGLNGDALLLPEMLDQTNPMYEGISPLYEGNGSDAITYGTTELIVIAVVSAVLVWLLVGLSLVCYRFLTRHSEECSPCESPDDTRVAVLYGNMEYCHTDTCPSRIEDRTFLQKFKEWWYNKFRRCPQECQDKYADEERCLAAINYSSKDVTNGNTSNKSCQRNYGKSALAIPSATSRGCVSFTRKVYSSSSETMMSETPAKTR